MEYSFWSLIAGATLTVKLIMALLTLMSLSSLGHYLRQMDQPRFRRQKSQNRA